MPLKKNIIEITPQLMSKAQKINSHEVTVIEYAAKKENFYQDQTLVTGYLANCSDTDML